jgi:hypothetical protein
MTQRALNARAFASRHARHALMALLTPRRDTTYAISAGYPARFGEFDAAL